jgi:hypothetical protein
LFNRTSASRSRGTSGSLNSGVGQEDIRDAVRFCAELGTVKTSNALREFELILDSD